MQIRFYGAARGVTGSCFMLENGSKILVDIGMFQGSVEKRNYRRFSFEPHEIDAVIITHSHLDHIGLLPKLVSKGFNGEVFSTPATREIAKYMLYDAAKVQEEEAEQISRKNLMKGKKPVKPLYESRDVDKCWKLKWNKVKIGKEINIDDNYITLHRAGHVIGSAFVEIDTGKRFVFSGDLGEEDKLIIKGPDLPPKTDYLIVESTYGNRNHKSIKESIEELREAINTTFMKGGNVLIPSFALERTQEILYVLHRLHKSGKLPDCRVFLDSPLAIDITGIFKRHPELYNTKTDENPFSVPNLKMTKSIKDSREINDIKENAIIIAGSGMCNGGRIKHHLKHNLWRKECSLVIVGWQAYGTLGRKLVDGLKRVWIYGEQIAVKSKIYTINGFSAHAGRDYLIKWSNAAKPGRTFIVHGEFEVSQKLANELRKYGHDCVIPKWKQNIEV